MATTEVADHLLAMDFVDEANVYGVRVPGNRFGSETFLELCKYKLTILFAKIDFPTKIGHLMKSDLFRRISTCPLVIYYCGHATQKNYLKKYIF